MKKRLLLALILLLPGWYRRRPKENSVCSGKEEPANGPLRANRDSTGARYVAGYSTWWQRHLDVAALRGAGREGNVILAVAGFGITLGRAPEPEYADVVTRSGRVKLYLFNCGESGSQLVGVDYDGYASKRRVFSTRSWEFNPCRSLVLQAGCSNCKLHILFCHRFEFCRG